MATPGLISIRNKDEQERTWLLTYSDGHTADIYRELKKLPEFCLERMILAYKEQDNSIGKYWIFNCFSDRQWYSFLSKLFIPHAPFVSGLIVNRHFGRWLPVSEQVAMYWIHTLQQEIAFQVICDSNGYDIVPNERLLATGQLSFVEEEDADVEECDDVYEVVRVDFLERLKFLIDQYLESNNNSP
jgi:hypothetical protein